MKSLALVSVIFSLFYSDAAFAYFWTDGNGRPCDEVCPAPRSRPVVSGTYRSTDARLHGQEFFVCRANASREGLRAGYNLKPNWSRHCWVGRGGQERAEPRYQCLCSETGVEPSWVDYYPAYGATCEDACRSPSRPVISGTYVSSNPRLHRQPFFVCAANLGSEGYRAGYHLRNFKASCRAGWGGAEQDGYQSRCLCE